MPGMNSGLSPADPTLVAAFRSALLHQGAIALILIAFLGLAWATARVWRRTATGTKPDARNRTAGLAVRRWRIGGSASRRPVGCCGSGSGCSGSWTGSCRSSRRWRPGWPRRSSGPPQRPRRPGSSTWSTGAGPSGPTTPSSPARPRCGSRSVSAPGSSPRRTGRGPGWPGWPAWPGASSCGCSGSRSAGSSRPA